MAEQCYLGVDLGAESGRVTAGLFDGAQVRLETIHRFPNGPVSVADSLRWDVLRLWSEIQQGLAQAVQKFGAGVVSAGVDTWGVDYVLLGKRGEFLGQPYCYRDPRTQGMLAYALSRVPKREIFAASGLQFMEINSLYQLLSFARTEGELMAQAERFLLMADVFHWLLCGSQVVEFTNATTTQCFDAQHGTWAFDLLRKLEIPSNMFGEVVQPGTRLGRLRASIANRLGIPRLEIVTPATHDTGSAVAAVPTELTGSPRWAYISSGTWSLIGVEVERAVITDRAFELNVTNEGGIDGTYRLLKNVMGLWLVQECRRSFERAGRPIDYAEMARQATAAPGFRAFVNPDDPRFLAPDDMPAAIREWCQASGQPVPQSEGELLRCVLESLALKYRVILDGLEELTGVPIEVIHVVGGGSQNELLNQLT
ncbi:MAG TPA: rhamnulokinase family protein, partial [Planctomycetaceae bacterium]|nr:rhamnulokinase family protein [Planctomycetaceae bacterium]